ncbi:MAG TPA: GNAT family N-acetyltransferase [Dehalococcoidia bacterium]|jgi:L-amino acid N-acyltransferase YncA|nr:GNAT family N-acetyltransferase [Dehalococcoidia bacterium]
MKAYKMTAYPREITVRDGKKITVRPLAPADRDALARFFLALPAEDRYFLKDDVTSPRVIESWTAQIDFDRVLPLVACSGDEIVAEAVLLRRRHGAYRGVGTVRVSVAKQQRGQGVGTALIHELCDIAADAGMEKIAAEFVAGAHDDAIDAAERLGFIRSAIVHEFLRDERGRPHDVVLLVLPLGKWYEWAQF